MSSRRFRAKRFVEWPRHDQRRWAAAMEPACPLDDPGPGARWRPATKATVLNAYAISLQWLDDKGWLDPNAPPAARWTRTRLRAYIDELVELVRPSTVQHRVEKLERALALLDPTADRTLLQRAVTHLGRRHDSARKRSRLREPADLVDLGFRLMHRADQGRHSNARKNATIYRVGLQVALLALRPLRMKNFSEIRLGPHLFVEQNHWQLRFSRRDEEQSPN